MVNALHNYEEKDESSGVHRVPKVSEIVKFKKDNFERALLDLEEDSILKNLVKMAAHGVKNKAAGSLRLLVEELRDFESTFLVNGESFFELDKQFKQLEQIYKDVLEKVVADWPQLMALGVDWYQLNAAISGHMLRIAGVFGLSGELNSAIQDWGVKYTKQEERKHQLRHREMLNTEALNAHTQLAYLSMNGKSSEEVIGKVRQRIGEIDNQLRKLPVDTQALPAFSTINPQFQPKVMINMNSKAEIKPVASAAKAGLHQTSDTVKQEPQKATSGWRSFAKKIPLLGRLF